MSCPVLPQTGTRRLCVGITWLAALAGCAGFSPSPVYVANREATPAAAETPDKLGRDRSPADAPAPMQPASPFRPVAERSDPPSPVDAPGSRRIVIYTATYRIVVPEIGEAIRQAEALAKEADGWVQTVSGDTVILRVPAAAYDATVAKVEALGLVSHRELQAADVTEEFVDLEARLKNARAVRERMQELLSRAENVTAALEVEKELKRLGEEIERMEAKLEVLRHRVAYSTITITFERVSRLPVMPHQMRLPFQWLRELDPRRLANG